MKNKESLKRSEELTEATSEYLAFQKQYLKLEQENYNRYKETKNNILKYYNASEEDWKDYKWQLKHRISRTEEFAKFMDVSDEILDEIDQVIEFGRMGISPYYYALINVEEKGPIFLQAVPTIEELESQNLDKDPMAEEFTNPAGSITRRYPDRLIINVTNQCGMYCRHCQRRRLINTRDHHTPIEQIDESIAYVQKHKEIRDVLITGGDAFLLSDTRIEYILQKLREIPHVEIIRLGTRTPVTLPQRVTKELVRMLAKYHPIYVNTQFNHPFEITEEAKNAVALLADQGIYVGNQSVLLKGVNNDKFVMRYLCQKLLQIRVRPYYLFHAKKVTGTKHFIPTINEGLEIMEHLRGNTSGLAIPTYILNAPGGLGKIPLLPDYHEQTGEGEYILTTWEGNKIKYSDMEM